MERKGWGVALGNFDGVHLGHRELMRVLREYCTKNRLNSLVFTFKQHPQNVLSTINRLPLIYDARERKRIIEGLGIDRVEMADFTTEISKMAPVDFLERILLDKYNLKYIVVGFNYRFGYRGCGDTSLLKRFGSENGIRVDIIDPVCVDGDIVSSSLIRALISSGNIKRANRLLGDVFHVDGQVERGMGRGRDMGFPTANISLPDDILYPARGVYITNTKIYGKHYPSITNVGINPTFSGNKMGIETFIKGFDQKIYGQTIRVEFIDRIRNEIKFKDREELKNQIELDLLYLENYLYINKQ